MRGDSTRAHLSWTISLSTDMYITVPYWYIPSNESRELGLDSTVQIGCRNATSGVMYVSKAAFCTLGESVATSCCTTDNISLAGSSIIVEECKPQRCFVQGWARRQRGSSRRIDDVTRQDVWFQATKLNIGDITVFEVRNDTGYGLLEIHCQMYLNHGEIWLLSRSEWVREIR